MEPDRRSGPIEEGTLLWEPSEEYRANAIITHFMGWLEETRNLSFASYQDLWQWSVTDLEAFWASIWDYFQIKAHSPYEEVLTNRRMPGAHWFPGATLNYAEQALSRSDDHPAIISQSENRPLSTLTFRQLHRQVASVAAGLRALGVRKGDRVGAFMSNIQETVVAFLATASIGAVWSSCSPEFGVRSVVERFQQIEPQVLLAVDGYRYGGRDHSRLEAVKAIQEQLPSLEHTILVPNLDERPSTDGLTNAILWQDAQQSTSDLTFEPVPFEHPLWVLFSSGTTGLPKPIVQGHGGIILEHLKTQALHLDLTSEDRFFWFTTVGWMMWNLLVTGLARGTTILLYDGSAGHPDMGALWKFAQDSGATYFGASAPYIYACMKAGVEPGKDYDLGKLKGLGSTGAPLSPEGFHWVYENVKPDIHLGSYCGGTDVCTGFLGPVPLLPVHAGEIQCMGLGALVEAYDPHGRPVIDEVGELVLTEPLPSMPLYFWNDPDGCRYRESYFEAFPGVWRHGDWIKKTKHNSCVIYGRSDSTLNRGGVRMGTSEFYRVVEEMDEVQDSLVIDTGQGSEEGRLLLFLQLRGGTELDDDLRSRIRRKLRQELSPRHAPDEVYAIPEVPTTLNAKKLEVPVKRIIAGADVEKVINRDAMSNPEALEFFVKLAREQS